MYYQEPSGIQISNIFLKYTFTFYIPLYKKLICAVNKVTILIFNDFEFFHAQQKSFSQTLIEDNSSHIYRRNQLKAEFSQATIQEFGFPF